jgi:hypothetical protein
MSKDVLKESPKKDSEAAKKARSAQSVGKVKLNDTTEYEIVKDGKHLKKSEKVKLNKPTAGLFKELGLIN